MTRTSDRGLVIEPTASQGRLDYVRIRGRPSQDSAAGCDLNRSNAPAIQHEEPITVCAAQHAGILGKRRDDVVNKLFFVGEVRFIERDVHAVAAEEPDTQHHCRHVMQPRPAAIAA
jgi:hypothetical protein